MNYSIIAKQIYALAQRLFAADVTRFIWNKKIFWINEKQNEDSVKEISSLLKNTYDIFFKAFNKILKANDFKMSKGTFTDRGFKGNTISYIDEAGVEIKLNTIPFGSSQIIVSIFIEDKKFIFTDLKKVQIGYEENEISNTDFFNEYQKKIKKFLEEFKKQMNIYMNTINSEDIGGYEDNDDDSIEDRDFSDLDEDYSDEI